MMWRDLTVTLKLRPTAWLLMFQVMSDAASTVQASYAAGALAVDQNFLTAAEFFRRVTPIQYNAWITRKSSNVYNYRMPFSVAISVCKIIQSLPTYTAAHIALHEIVSVRLYDSGVDIQYYIAKK